MPFQHTLKRAIMSRWCRVDRLYRSDEPRSRHYASRWLLLHKTPLNWLAARRLSLFDFSSRVWVLCCFYLVFSFLLFVLPSYLGLTFVFSSFRPPTALFPSIRRSFILWLWWLFVALRFSTVLSLYGYLNDSIKLTVSISIFDSVSMCECVSVYKHSTGPAELLQQQWCYVLVVLVESYDGQQRKRKKRRNG